MPPRPVIKLELEALPLAGVPLALRVRKALKCLLRGFGLRCKRIEMPDEDVVQEKQDGSPPC